MTPDDYTRMREDLVEVRTMLTEMHHRLLGNGQKGAIAELEDRVRVLERRWYGVMGAAGLLSFGVGVAMKVWK